MLDAELQYRYSPLRLTEITSDMDLAGAFRKRRTGFSDEIVAIQQCRSVLELDSHPKEDQRMVDDCDVMDDDGDFWEIFTRR